MSFAPAVTPNVNCELFHAQNVQFDINPREDSNCYTAPEHDEDDCWPLTLPDMGEPAGSGNDGTTNLEVALDYARHGIPVLPGCSGVEPGRWSSLCLDPENPSRLTPGKIEEPIADYHEGTIDPSIIRAQWQQWPNALPLIDLPRDLILIECTHEKWPALRQLLQHMNAPFASVIVSAPWTIRMVYRLPPAPPGSELRFDSAPEFPARVCRDLYTVLDGPVLADGTPYTIPLDCLSTLSGTARNRKKWSRCRRHYSKPLAYLGTCSARHRLSRRHHPQPNTRYRLVNRRQSRFLHSHHHTDGRLRLNIRTPTMVTVVAPERSDRIIPVDVKR